MSTPDRRQIAQWAEQYLAGHLSFEQFFRLVPEGPEDEQIAELLDLVEHEPTIGAIMGVSPDIHQRHMARVRELVNLLSTDP